MINGTGGGDIVFDPGASPGGGDIPREQCASAAYKGTLLPASILFMVDRSGSMNCNLPPTTDSAACEQNPVAADPNQPTKWSVISNTLSGAIDTIAAVPNTSLGLGFFSVDDTCGVQSAPSVELAPLSPPQVDALKGALGAVKPKGGTPIVGSVILAFHHLHQEAQASGNRFVVLVTDGSDSCIGKYAVQGDVVSQLLNTEMPKAISVNIHTFVIGAPGSEPARGLLSKIAFAGGTPHDPNCDHTSDNPAPGTECHFDMTRSSDFAKDLGDALQRIGGSSAMTCEFAVPASTDGKAVDRTKVNVDYYKAGKLDDAASKVELYRDDTKPCAAGANGWQYIDGDQKIQICGSACNDVLGDKAAQVVVSVGCEQRSIR
jgi:hypothetical protein